MAKPLQVIRICPSWGQKMSWRRWSESPCRSITGRRSSSPGRTVSPWRRSRIWMRQGRFQVQLEEKRMVLVHLQRRRWGPFFKTEDLVSQARPRLKSRKDSCWCRSAQDFPGRSVTHLLIPYCWDDDHRRHSLVAKLAQTQRECVAQLATPLPRSWPKPLKVNVLLFLSQNLPETKAVTDLHMSCCCIMESFTLLLCTLFCCFSQAETGFYCCC